MFHEFIYEFGCTKVPDGRVTVGRNGRINAIRKVYSLLVILAINSCKLQNILCECHLTSLPWAGSCDGPDVRTAVSRLIPTLMMGLNHLSALLYLKMAVFHLTLSSTHFGLLVGGC